MMISLDLKKSSEFRKAGDQPNGTGTLKPRYIEQVCQTLFVNYIEKFTISNVIYLVNLQNGS